MAFPRCIVLGLIGMLLLCGCTAETETGGTPVVDVGEVESNTDLTTATEATPPAADAANEVDGTDVADEAGEVEVPPYETTPPIETPVSEYTTAKEYIDAIQKQLASASSGLSRGPTREAVDEAIATIDLGRAKLPDDEELLRVAAVLRYQSLPLVGQVDPAAADQRRLELGELARTLVARNKDALETLANMPAVLLLEEAKALISTQDGEKAWASVREARSLGFNQSEILFFDPGFADFIEQPQMLAEIERWVAEDVEAKLASAEGFPFDFTLRSLTDEREVSLSDFAGKVVIVDFWGTWCPPCRAAIPHLVELAEEHPDELAVVGINFERNAPFEEAKAALADFVESQPINYPCVYGEESVAAQVPEFGSFPTMVFVDKSGSVRLSVKGYQPLPVLAATVNALLSD